MPSRFSQPISPVLLRRIVFSIEALLGLLLVAGGVWLMVRGIDPMAMLIALIWTASGIVLLVSAAWSWNSYPKPVLLKQIPAVIVICFLLNTGFMGLW